MSSWISHRAAIVPFLLAAALMAGCAGSPRQGTSRVDPFDAVQVDEMVGNNVSPAPLQKVIVCLNARRESRPITAVTNVAVQSITNQTVLAATNEVVSIATNFLVTTMTNLSPAQGGGSMLPQTPEEMAAAAASDVHATLHVTNTAPSLSTNVSMALARNSTSTAGPSQRGANLQEVRTFNQQLTTTSNNLTVTVMTNWVVTTETNLLVNYVTNTAVTTVTNIVLSPTNGMAHDYFLCTELIPPPDFNLHPGESLILLIDGVRHGFTAGQTGTVMVPRRRFTSTAYRVPPDVLVAIANAQEVRVRIRGTSSVIERTMTPGSQYHLKTFLVRYFSPEPPGEVTKSAASTSVGSAY